MDTKNFLASRTIWGGILVIAATAARLFGLDIGDTGGWVEDILIFVGGVLAIYGRVKAIKKISLV